MDDTTDFDPTFEDDRLWSETLVFPHPLKLNDDAMDYYFPDYDGRWSRQTKRAMEKFDAKGLEMNSNWALENQFWSCPGCGRSKPEIFRKSSNGILLAKLELHHDHLWDEGLRRPEKLLGSEWKGKLMEGATVVMDTIRSLVVRFDEALVCSECNAADGKAKKALKADPSFSFAASEIRTFVKATPHYDHEIDVEAAKAVWETERPGFDRRVAILDMLVGDLAAGRLQRRLEGRLRVDRRMFQRIGAEETLHKAFRRSAKGTVNTGLLQTMRSDFLARSVQKHVMKRERPKTVVRRPTDEEYGSYIPENVAKKWAETNEDWACPCCGRGKRASMRLSSKKKWTGTIRAIAQYDVLLDEDEILLRECLFPSFPNDLHLQEMRWVDVCSDCADIETRLGQSCRDLAAVYLSIDQMRSSLADVGDNVPHEIDFDLAVEMSGSNWRYRHAGEAVSAFISLRNSFRSRMDFASERKHLRQDTFAQLGFELEVRHRIEDAQQRKDIMSMFRDGDYGKVRNWSKWW